MGQDYIVTLASGADARGLARSLRLNPRFVYSGALDGFAGALTPGQVQALQQHAAVTGIERDQLVLAADVQPVPPDSGLGGLDRIDQRQLPLSGGYTYAADASNVTAYVIDSGLDADHEDFGGRARNVYDAHSGGDGQDCNGHGTHVAGTIGGRTHGVAKAVQLRGLRVVDCAGRGSAAAVIAAVDWLRTHHVKPAVANIALATGKSKALNTAVSSLIEAGVVTAVSAGNDNRDACKVSPASASGVLTVAASDVRDVRAPFSNYGRCVELYAPGVQVMSTWTGGRTATDSGTSMSSAHVTGAAALYRQAHPQAPPADVGAWLTSSSTLGVIQQNPSKTPNRLLFTSSP